MKLTLSKKEARLLRRLAAAVADEELTVEQRPDPKKEGKPGGKKGKGAPTELPTFVE